MKLYQSSPPPGPSPSPLILCDRLLRLAEEAERAGCAVTAEHLLFLAHTVLEETPGRQGLIAVPVRASPCRDGRRASASAPRVPGCEAARPSVR